MIDRMFKSWKTTLVGVFVVGISVYAFLKQLIGFYEMWGGIIAGFVAFGLRDKGILTDIQGIFSKKK